MIETMPIAVALFGAAFLWYRTRILELRQVESQHLEEFREEMQICLDQCTEALRVAHAQDHQIKQATQQVQDLASVWEQKFTSQQLEWEEHLSKLSADLSTKMGLKAPERGWKR